MRRVGVVTSWACRCGIAEYSRSLLQAVPGDDLEFVILADAEVDFSDDSGFSVERCWRKSSDDIGGILAAVRRRRIELVLVEFNWGYLNPRPLGLLLAELDALGVPTLVQFHSSDDRVVDGEAQSLADISAPLSTTRALIVHSDADERRIAALAPGVPVERTVLGQTAYPDEDPAEVRAFLGLDGRTPVLASFGFLLPHKGILEMIQAMPAIRSTRPHATFLAVCSVLSSWPVSVMHWRRCQREIRRLHLTDAVALVTDFLPEAAAMTLLHAANVLVLPYLDTGESASAAVRYALASARPVVTTSASIFDSLGDAVYRIHDATPESIAAGVSAVLDDPGLREKLLSAARKLSHEAEWSAVGERLGGLLHTSLGSHRTDAEVP